MPGTIEGYIAWGCSMNVVIGGASGIGAATVPLLAGRR